MCWKDKFKKKNIYLIESKEKKKWMNKRKTNWNEKILSWSHDLCDCDNDFDLIESWDKYVTCFK